VKFTKDHKDGKYGPFGNTSSLHELTLLWDGYGNVNPTKTFNTKATLTSKTPTNESLKKWKKKTKNFKLKNNFNKIRKHNMM
jgi:hypothetical protein